MDKIRALFARYYEYFGWDNAIALAKQLEFKEAMRELFCDVAGHHEFDVDHCKKPEHDFCQTCGKLASELGYCRDHDWEINHAWGWRKAT